MRYEFDPELAPLVPAMSAIPSFHEDPPAARRAIRDLFANAAANPDDSDSVARLDLVVDGDIPVPVRVYRPVENLVQSLPLVLHMHGGAFITGDLDLADSQCAHMCRRLPALVISVDYRLAPEHRYPAAVNDCYAALCWAARMAPQYGADPGRLAVSGESAGGALAAALTLMSRDRNGPRIAYQRLLIPVLDDRCETDSAREMVGAPIFDSVANRGMWPTYLGTGSRDVPSPYAAPARATDLHGLPPAYIQVAEYDPARDEGLEYARRLTQAGVHVELHLVPRAFHGFAMATRSAVARRAASLALAALSANLTGTR